MNQTMLVAVMVAYLALTTGVAFFYGLKKTASTEDYTVANRSFGGVVLFFTLFATVVGASSVMGYTNYFYVRGVDQFFFAIGANATYLVYVFFIGPRIHKFGVEKKADTVSDWFEFRFGKAAKFLSAVLNIVAYVAITAFQYLAMATIMNLILGWDMLVCQIVTAAIVIVYTSVGGLWAVASTDVLQGVMTLLGIAVMTPVLVTKAGGVAAIFAAAPASNVSFFGNVTLAGAVASMLTLGLGQLSWPDLWQRCYAAKSAKVLKRSFLSFMAGTIAIAFTIMFLGFAAHVFYPDYAGSANELLPRMIMDYIPNFAGAVFLAALLAVIMGTADSTLLVSSIMLEKDILLPVLKLFRKQDLSDKASVRMHQVVTAICGFSVLIVLHYNSDMFNLWVMSADLTGATLAVPILIGFACGFGSRLACAGAIVCGFLAWLPGNVARMPFIPQGLYDNVLQPYPIIVGSVASLVAYVLLALAERPRARQANPKSEAA